LYKWSQTPGRRDMAAGREEETAIVLVTSNLRVESESSTM